MADLINRIHEKFLYYIYRRNHIKYARRLGVTVGNDCKFVDNPNWGSEPYLISIGDHVLLSGDIVFSNHDGATWVFREIEEYKGVYKFGRITIGNNCFIGHRSILLPNVTIGDNSIVAAGSVVNKDIPSGEVWGGVPARFIMTTNDYANKCKANVLPYDIIKLKEDKRKELLRIFGEPKL